MIENLDLVGRAERLKKDKNKYEWRKKRKGTMKKKACMHYKVTECKTKNKYLAFLLYFRCIHSETSKMQSFTSC